ncbi:MAG: RsbRD N-terminal domain-containing protein [candidate division Zixibacteria bacterium]|nr:RsbRD N-terminal domain-containing protein [candidate division Zixibacteria bacterium]MBU1471295.1 RsbRD N-terminal domain-containing protein [candidate division Zixibacteria bacterium]MBU2625685.1 RsbRD N-terminal domain-containing protein [candidate division Zixibacteria bacterium]
MLIDILKKRRKAVLEDWLDRTLATYPPDSVDFFKNQKNRFSNPVGFTIERELALIFEEITGDMDEQNLRASAESLVKIRAVQDFKPSDAVAFVFELKNVVRAFAMDQSSDKHLADELHDLDTRIDRFALYAFDAYMLCRETICKIRNREATMGTFSPLERRAKASDDTCGSGASDNENNPSVKRHEGSGR